MKLKRLVSNNFQSFQNAEITFDGLKVISINGSYKKENQRSNGSGKSSIFDSIIYALYGKSRTKKEEDLVRENTNEMSVELEFELSSNESIKIIRGRSKDKGFLNFEVNGEDKSGGKIETQKFIEDKIGMDYELFVATLFFQQEGSDKFTGATPTDRKNYLKKLFNLGIYDRAYKKTNEKMKAVNGNLMAAKAKIDYIKEQNNEVNTEELKIEIEKNNKKLELLKIELSELSKKKESIKELKQKLEVLSDSKKRIKLDLEYEEEEYVEITNEIMKKEKNIKAVKVVYDKTEKVTDKDLEDVKEKGDLVNKEISDIESDIKIFEMKKKDLVNKLNSLDDKNDCPVCNNKLTKEYKDKFKEDINLKIHKLESDNVNKYIDLKNKQKEILILKEKYKTVRKNLNEYNNLESQIKEDEKIIEIKKKEVLKVFKKVNELIKEKKEIDKKISMVDIPDNYISILEKINDKDDDKIELIKSIQKSEGELKNYEKSQKELKKIKVEHKGYKDQLNGYNILKQAFGKNGITANIIKESIDEIERESNEILQKINNGEYRIIFDTEKSTKKGEISDSLDIYIENNRAIRIYESYSGGQRAIINFAIRMALSKILSKVNQVAFGFIALDEIFHSLDEYNKEKMIDIINYLKPIFHQMLIISHTNLKECFENSILIEYDKTKGISRIKEIL